MHNIINMVVPVAVEIIECIGILILLVGVGKALYFMIKGLITKTNTKWALKLSTSMANALPFLMASEILETVIVKDASGLLRIAAVIVMRTIFVVLIHYEAKHEEDLEEIQHH